MATSMPFQINVPKYKLNNGREIPAIALGTFLGFNERGMIRSKDNMLRDLVLKAIDVGYRHFDTAAIYKTEEEVGEAVRMKIQEENFTRDDFFITTKLWNTSHKKDQVMKALKESLNKLGLDYVDLYLMHWPLGLNDDNTFSFTDYIETWQGMEAVVEAGLARSIGVCNFNHEQLQRLVDRSRIRPAVLQVEVHLQMAEKELVKFAQWHNITVMGYSPFGFMVKRYGKQLPGLRFNTEPLPRIAKKYNKTTAQLVLRWFVERKIIPIPKTLSSSHLIENIDIFDFEIEDEDMHILSMFNGDRRFTVPSFWQDHPLYPFEKIENPIGDPFVRSNNFNATH